MIFTSEAAKWGTDHLQWIKDLDFYKDELSILSKRLVEVVSKNNSPEVMVQAEHFQNQFTIQRNNIDELKHAIGEHNSIVAQELKLHAGRTAQSRIARHEELKDQQETLQQIINDLRNEFKRFLSEWM